MTDKVLRSSLQDAGEPSFERWPFGPLLILLAATVFWAAIIWLAFAGQ